MATPRKLTVTDAHLAEALAGRAYLLFDGGMGTLVQAAGLHTVHEVPDLLNLTHPEAIVAIQRQYVEAGADCITTNTFNTNRLKLANAGATVAEVYAAAAANARVAGAPLVAGDIGPTGALLEPLGTLTFDEASTSFPNRPAPPRRPAAISSSWKPWPTCWKPRLPCSLRWKARRCRCSPP